MQKFRAQLKFQTQKFKAANLLPWSAFLISISSLALSVFQANESRNHERLSFMPHLFLARFGRVDPPFGIYVENEGIGPAIVQDIEILFKGERVLTMSSLRDGLLRDVNEASGSLSFTEINKGYYYRAGQRENLIRGSEKLDQKIRYRLFDNITKFVEIKITYCSVYEDCKRACLIADNC
jgi:hypothetical protein